MLKKSLVAGLAVIGLSDVAAQAVIVTGDQGRNTTVTAGSLAETGWNLQGNYGNFLGTPISADWFVTANHFGAADTSITTIDNVAHPVINTVNIAGTDLVLRQVSVPFTSYATIFNPATDGGVLTNTDQLYVYGRGTSRGDAITGRGWNWGDDDHARSYGTNNFAGFATIEQSDIDNGSTFALGTTFLTGAFDQNVSPNEGTLSNGDSGGAVFVVRGGQLKLVAINYGVDLYATSSSGPNLSAAIYDASGLYEQLVTNGPWVPVTGDSPVPQMWYSSYLPNSISLINATVPEPTSLGILVVGAGLLTRRRRA